MENLEVIILAAGQGKRMRSALPKVLHLLGGRPLLAHVLAAAEGLTPRAIHVVYGHGGGQVRAAFDQARVRWVEQTEQLGTGHAVLQAIGAVADDAVVLVLYGDVPLIRVETLQALLAKTEPFRVGLLTAEVADPSGYGRIVRHRLGHVERIVEQRDATPEEAAIREINTGILAAPAALLRQWLARLENRNAQREYYLTDVIAMAAAEGIEIVTRQPQAGWEILGVNSRRELAELERIYQRQQADALLEQGVTLRDPARFDLRGEVRCGRDVVIDVNVVLEGRVSLGDGVYLGPNTVIRDAEIGADTQILANCVIEEAEIGAGCRIGPFARLRPGSRLAEDVHVGNFVEIKQSEIGAGSKANHLAYIGDTTIGRGANVGAGTITCNYDGANKHRTIIGDGAFIGSNTALVAPVAVGAGATIGAGSVITRDVPAEELAVARGEQRNIKGWKRPGRKEKAGDRG
ncbi:MAG TPA: bifunctional UDP-N-acetylglucosamine diphosphorylase/glucosamine-1-phosphate N-acetyltransferase GlmU [Burkholderiales bacterium]